MGDHWSDASGETNSQGVTGGVYRAQVHIHRGMAGNNIFCQRESFAKIPLNR